MLEYGARGCRIVRQRSRRGVVFERSKTLLSEFDTFGRLRGGVIGKPLAPASLPLAQAHAGVVVAGVASLVAFGVEMHLA